MKVFFAPENESISKHLLDALDSRDKRQKRHHPAKDRPGYNTLQQSVLELLRQEKTQDEKGKRKQMGHPTWRKRSQQRQAYIFTE